MSALPPTRQNRILIDSNVYFRLAQTVHPLLGREFGSQRYCLYLIDGFEAEYFKNSRLKTSFAWVQYQQFSANRGQKIQRSRKESQECKFNVEYLKDTAQEKDLTTSPVDIDALALALTLDIPIVTDDRDMLTLAAEYNIKTMKTLELMKLMLDEGHITDATVNAITSYWSYSGDLPKDFSADFRQLFLRDPQR